MRPVLVASTLAGFGLLLLSTHSALAQGGVMGVGGGGGIGGVAGGIQVGFGIQASTGEPYSALRKSTHVQKLADGTTITQESSRKEARDSNGRTYHESRIEIPAQAMGLTSGFTIFNVFDPVNCTQITWTSNSKEATVIHMPTPGQSRQPTQDSFLTQMPMPPFKTAPAMPEIEDLGTKTINGIEASGKRVTTTIPTGRMGNDRPLKTTNEFWTSLDLRVVVLEINDDPLRGTTTTELTDIDHTEPDPALFHAPDGYTVKDQYPGQHN